MKRFLSPFLRHAAGATAMEFAIVAPVFLLILMGILEFSLILYTRGIIEIQTHATARMVMTGDLYGQTGTNRNTYFKQRLENSLKDVVFNDSNLNISTTIFDSYAQLAGGASGRQTSFANDDPNTTNFFGTAGQVVRFRVNYTYQYITPLSGLMNAAVGTVPIQSTVYIRNEDF